MARYTKHLPWLFALFFLFSGTELFGRLAPSVKAQPTLAQISNSPIPLPGGCGGGNPPTSTTPVCCMFGYVYLDGQAVKDAYLVVTNLRTGVSVEAATGDGRDSTEPYYQLSLSDPPLSLQAGDRVEIYAEFSSHATTIEHVVRGGSQQIDLLLPRTGTTDYAFERQYWEQSPAGSFNMYRGELAISRDGLVYVADWGDSRIQVFNQNGQFVRQWGSLGNTPGQFMHPSGLDFDQQGNVYVADSSAQRVHKYTSGGVFISSWGGFGSGNGEFGFARDLVVDSENFVYVVDGPNHRIQKFTSNGEFVAAWGSQGNGSNQLNFPHGIALGPDGLLYVADAGNHRIQVFTRIGTPVRRWGSSGEGDGQFDQPERVVVAPNGTVYVSDTHHDDASSNYRVQYFSNTGTYQGQWGGFGTGNGQFLYPGGLAIGNNNEVFVADDNDRVQVFSPTGAYQRQWGSKGFAAGRADQSYGITPDGNGGIYTTDVFRSLVQHFDANGNPLASFGSYGSGNNQFIYPNGITRASNGDLYIADAGNYRVQVFSANGTYLRTVGNGQGNGNGQFQEPVGVALDASNNLYVLDSGNHRLQKFDSNGNFVWVLGGPGAGSANGQFDFPRSLTIDSNGNIYVADTNNDRVQIINPNGTYAGKWGQPGGGSGQLNTPSGIAIGPDGNLYVAEFNNYRFQVFTPAGQSLLTWGFGGIGKGLLNQPARIAVDASGRVFISEPNVGRVQVLKPMTATRPIASIVAATPRNLTPDKPVELLGKGGDPDATDTIVAYEWSLNNSATPFATTANTTIAPNTLAPGTHQVSLRVRDDEGEYSAPQTITLVVAQTGTPAPKSWTFLLYMAGDNIATSPFFDYNSPSGALFRLQRARFADNVTVIALFDGESNGDSTISLFRSGQPVESITPLVAGIPVEATNELNMGSPQTLTSFVRWGKQRAPADAYYLAIADHGNALDGIAWDFRSAPNRTERLTNAELREALIQITDNGSDPLDILHLDACLMGLIEPVYELQGQANYVIASEYLSWSLFAYDSYVKTVGPATEAKTLATSIANEYASQISELNRPATISVYEMQRMDAVISAMRNFASALQRYVLLAASNRDQINALRNQVQKLDSSGDVTITAQDTYVDIDHFAELVASQINDQASKDSAATLRSALSALYATPHFARSGTYNGITVDLSNARGLAIYLPPQLNIGYLDQYRNTLSFAAGSSWDEVLQTLYGSLSLSDPPPLNPVEPLPVTRQYELFMPIVRQ
jgi:sugar lactone lactonase YvrE